MRDDETYHDDAPASGGWRPALGAALSLCLLGGTVVWVYQLGARDAADVPVIRALAGDVRMRPETPGGAHFAHQERGVYAVIEGGSAGLGEVALAPAPESLTAEDLPAAKLAAAALPAAAPAPDPAASDAPVALDAAEGVATDGEIAAAALVQPAEIAPANEVDMLVAMVLDAAPGAAFVEPGAAAPRVSPAAPPRPARAASPAGSPAANPNVETAVVQRASFSPGETAPSQVAAATAASAGPLIQIGAYLTRGDAERMWAAFRARNGDLMAGRAPVISQTASGERTLWLLRASGFERRADAGAVCEALKARGEDCILVRGG